MRIEHRGGKIAGLLGFAAICMAILVYLFLAAGGHIRFHRPMYASARVPTAFQLTNNGDVRSAGVKVGSISKINRVGDQAKVEFEINDKHFPLYKDAVVEVRTKTLVGENYLEIQPGSPQAGKLPRGGLIPLNQAREAVQLDQILNTLTPSTRRRVQQNLDGLGPGVAGRGQDINRIWAAMRPTSRDGGTVLRVLDGQKRELAALISDTGEVMQAFGDRTQDVRTLSVQAKRAAIAAASRDGQLRAAIRELGPTLAQARSSVRRLGDFSTRSAPVFDDLATVSGNLRPVLVDLQPAVSQTRTLFRVLPGALKQANPLLEQLTPFARALTPAIGALDRFLRQAGPAVQYLSPYAPEIGGMFANNGSVFATKDAIGHKGRVHAILSPSSIAAFTPDQRKLIQGLIAVGSAGVLAGEAQNPNPKPGDVASPKAGDGSYPRVQAGP
jgi:phospholipid/cholesterol/gamma-HCH transport system substrate-binding protein